MNRRKVSHQRRDPALRRGLFAEQLERRELMAGDAFHNADVPADVNGNGTVTAADALAVVNHMTRARASEAEATPTPINTNSASAMVDVDNNGYVTAKDALMVVNHMRAEALIVPAGSARPAELDYALFAKEALVDDDGFVGGEDLSSADSTFDVLKNFRTLAPTDPDFEYASVFNQPFRDAGADNLLTESDVETLLLRASQATRSNDAIIAVVDRNGTILGVRAEDEVISVLPVGSKELAFAIDGAVAKARTAAFFANREAPITSRTIRSLSQSTMTQRVVESSPVADTDEYRGPGFVAPIGVGGKFPPEVNFTPQVDLFAIEHQSRDSQRHPGPDQIKGNTDDFYLRTRFNANPTAIPQNSEEFFQTWPEAYGIQTDTFFDSQSRGIATLPGGIPLYKTNSNPRPGAPLSDQFNLVGGIGVFFPGEDGFATHEQGFEHASERGGFVQSEKDRTNAPKVLEAEFAALIAAAGNAQDAFGGLVNPFQTAFLRDLSPFTTGLTPLPSNRFFLPTGRIDLVGITLEIYGPNPDRSFRQPGIDRLIAVGSSLFGGIGSESGSLLPVNAAGDLLQAGQPVPEGWLVAPKDSAISGLTAEDVDRIIATGVDKALKTRAAIRLNIDGGFRPGTATGMVLSVADTNGELLGVYRMPDATIFSIDVSIAKSRNTAYYADPAALQDEDRIDFNGDGVFGPIANSLNDLTGDTLPPGTALTNRTFRFVVEPRFTTGIELPATADDGLVNDADLAYCDQNAFLCQLIAPQSILRMPGINPITGENLVDDAPLSSKVYQFSPDVDPEGRNTFSVLAFDAFNPSRNFRDPGDDGVIIHGDGSAEKLANQNGIVFFPGSTPLYTAPGTGGLAGGFGVSGDGVDQDDVVTAAGQVGFEPPAALRVDAFTVAGVRLPFQKFNRVPQRVTAARSFVALTTGSLKASPGA